jgi:hypothetical protein
VAKKAPKNMLLRARNRFNSFHSLTRLGMVLGLFVAIGFAGMYIFNTYAYSTNSIAWCKANRPILRVGSANGCVMTLQRFLYLRIDRSNFYHGINRDTAGCPSYPEPNIIGSASIGRDGIFGPQTRRYVQCYQQINGLTQDGVVGPNTYTAMYRACKGKESYFETAPVSAVRCD